jgi:hypothetical protein
MRRRRVCWKASAIEGRDWALAALDAKGRLVVEPGVARLD